MRRVAGDAESALAGPTAVPGEGTRDAFAHVDAVIGHYRIVRVIGRGGFDITYEAWDGDLNRAVAIKECFPHGMAQRAADGIAVQCLPRSEEPYAQGLRRFLDEARTPD